MLGSFLLGPLDNHELRCIHGKALIMVPFRNLVNDFLLKRNTPQVEVHGICFDVSLLFLLFLLFLRFHHLFCFSSPSR